MADKHIFLCQIWALYLKQVLNNTPVNKDPQPNFKLCLVP